MSTLYDILGELNKQENLLKKNPFLGAISILSPNDILKNNLISDNKGKSIYIRNTRNEGVISLGDKFDVVFSKDNPQNYIKTDATVEELSLKKGDNIGIMPEGQGGIVKLGFLTEIPDIIKLLKQGDSLQFDDKKNSYVFFTTQLVMNAILAMLNENE